MDTSFNCSKCNLHITADECVVGEEIDCPECGAKIRVPPPQKPKPVPVAVKSAATGAAPPVANPAHAPAKADPPQPAPEHKPLVVPHHAGPQESLVKKTAAPPDAKPEAPKLRVKTIKRGSCVEVGHDLFDEKVTDFLNKIGQENIINISPVGYGAMDSTGHMLPDYGIMIVYRG